MHHYRAAPQLRQIHALRLSQLVGVWRRVPRIWRNSSAFGCPFTFETCEVIEERWANWMRHDPVVAVETRRLKALYIECGERDQFNLLYGARRLVRRLNELGIAHRYEEFADNRSGVDYRIDEGLPLSRRRCPADLYGAKEARRSNQ